MACGVLEVAQCHTSLLTHTRPSELVRNRPNAINVNTAMCQEFGSVHWSEVQGREGGSIANHTSEGRVASWADEWAPQTCSVSRPSCPSASTVNGIYEWLPPWHKEARPAEGGPAAAARLRGHCRACLPLQRAPSPRWPGAVSPHQGPCRRPALPALCATWVHLGQVDARRRRGVWVGAPAGGQAVPHAAAALQAQQPAAAAAGA